MTIEKKLSFSGHKEMLRKLVKVALMHVWFLDILSISTTLSWTELSSAMQDKWLLSIFRFPMENQHS